MSKVIATPFTTAPKQAVVVKDVRGDVSANPVSNLEKPLDKVAAKAARTIQEQFMDRLRGLGNQSIADLVALNPKTSEDWFRLVVPGGKLDLDTLKQGVVSDVLKTVGYTGDASSMANKLLDVAEGRASVRTLIDNTPVMQMVVDGLSGPIESLQKAVGKDLGVVAFLAQNITGNTELIKFVNLDARGALTSQINKQLMKFELPGFHEKLTDNLTKKEKMEVAADAESLTTALDNGNLSYLNWVMTELGDTYVVKTVPDAIARLLASFKLDPYQDPAPQAALLENTLLKMHPPLLTQSTTGNDCVVWAEASEDAKRLLSTRPLCAILVACAEVLSSGPAMIDPAWKI